jgi:HEAT repeat protein
VNPEREPSSADPRDPLDDWLAQATWPRPSPESTARLCQQWLVLRARQYRWRELLAPLSAAAVVALAIGLAWVTQRRPHVPTVAIMTTRPHVGAQQALLVGRTPTVLESMVLRAAEEREKKRKNAATRPSAPLIPIAKAPTRNLPPAALGSVAPPPAIPRSSQPHPNRPDPVLTLLRTPDGAAIGRYLDLVSDQKTRTDALGALSRVANPPTDRMLAALNDPLVPRRVAAALALGRIDGPVLTRRLITMVAADQNRREALIALASSRGKEAREFVERAARASEFAGLAQSTLAMNEVRQTEVQ